MAARTPRRFAGGPGTAQRATPLLAAVVAIALTVAVFPDALHSSVAGPGPQGAVRPHAHASVTHEGDVPPLSLGQSGAGAEGSGAGTGRPSAVRFGGRSGGLGAGSNPGFGGGAGLGAGVGAGAGSGQGGGTGSSSPTQTPPASGSQPTQTPSPPSGSPPPPTSCPSCQGRQGTPSIPFCYSNSLGPDSQTTEDPLSPPCVPAYDAATQSNGGDLDPAHGVYADHIDVVLEGYSNAPAAVAEYNGVQCDPTIETEVVYGCTNQDAGILRAFMQSHYQTYGRTVVFHGDPDWGTYPTPQQHAADIAALHPFAVLGTAWGCCGHEGPAPTPDLSKYGIEEISFGFNGPNDPASLLSSPYVWSILPSTENVIRDGAAWVCASIAGRDVDLSHDPTMQGRKRHIALGYTSTSSASSGVGSSYEAYHWGSYETYLDNSKALAVAFAAEADRDCGDKGTGGHVFTQFDGTSALLLEDTDGWTGHTQDPSIGANAAAQLQSHQVTTVLCVFCEIQLYGPPWGPDPLLKAMESSAYLPEWMFVDGTLSDPSNAGWADQGYLDGAVGLTELWQAPAWLQTYWVRAYNAVRPVGAVSQLDGFSVYEEMMQLFGAIQLAGADLNSTSMAQGLSTWRRAFIPSDPTGARPGGSPAAGYSADDHSFLKGMMEERWNSAGAPPGGYLRNPDGGKSGCYGVVDSGQRFAARAAPALHLDDWSQARYSETQGIPPSLAPIPPCTAEYEGYWW